MNDQEVHAQINQMVQFIHQEAKEKAAERVERRGGHRQLAKAPGGALLTPLASPSVSLRLKDAAHHEA